MNTPLPITVIIPCYNMANTLARAVESALEAGAENVSILNDYSTDESARVVMRLESKYPNVRGYSHSAKHGVVYSRNFMILCLMREHNRDLIVPLDADDTLTPDGLRLLYEAYQPDTWVYGGWCERKSFYLSTATLNPPVEIHPEKAYEAPPPGMLNRKNICYATMLFHRDDWQKAGGYNPLFEIGAEDYAFQCALTHAGVMPVRVEGIIHTRYTSANGGGRSERAAKLWPHLHALTKELYPNAFD